MAKHRILFLCTGNSCRSILAEATFNHLAPDGWRAMSAGSHPAGFVHPRSLSLLARIEAFFALPLERLKDDRASLQAELDRIAGGVRHVRAM